ncbi:MAG: BamA/TamA family outer membrane protein [Candidatus Marinimicrobia bacterium]|nr:BamA/TamA family outer membrane protein [Candidatus Neomarinimicrobiota bacterium]
MVLLKQKFINLATNNRSLSGILLLLFALFFISADLANAQGLLRVKEIKIHGNENYSDGKIKGEMNLKSPGFPGFLRKGSEFNARILRLDRTSIRKFYESNGYIYAEITDSIEVLNRKDIIIHLNIIEGKQVKISEINVRGNDLIADTEILRMFESKLGKPLNPYLLRKDLATIRSAYQARGKPYAQFRNELKGDNNITIVIDIIENETVFIDSVIVLGTKKVNTNIVLRELAFNPNEKYNIERIEESRKRIFETGLFSNVTIIPVRTDTVNRRLNLVVTVRERRMRQLGAQIGFKQRKIAGNSEPVTDLNTVGEWYNRNLWSSGRLLRFKGNASVGATDFSTGQTRFEASYTEPWVLGQRAPTTLRAFIERERIKIPETITLTRFGVDLSLWKKFSEEFSARISQGITITNVIDDLDSLISDSLGIRDEDTQRSINLLIINDKRKNVFLPTNGSILTLEGKIAGGFMGGTSDIFRAEISWSRYQPFLLNKSWTLATRLKGGFINAYGNTPSIPFFDRFFLGGGNSVRGYKELQLQEFSGGEVKAIYKLLANIELRFPLFWRFGGEVFVDGGNLWNEIAKATPARMRYSVGGGITFMTPMGPARLDYGYKINPSFKDEFSPDYSPDRLHFGFLFAF